MKPIGSCQKVIEATKSFNDINDIHKMVCIGIIDRDHRDDDQIQFLSDRSIFCPDVAEVENLFLIEDLLLKVGEALCVEESELAVSKIKDFVISQFSGKIDEYSSKRVAHIIDSKLKKFDGSAIGIDDLKSRLHELHSDIDIDTLYQQSKSHAEKLIADSNYSEIIKVFNHKGIVRQIGAYFDVKPSAFIKKAKYLLSNESNGLIDIVRTHMPQG